MNPIKSITLKGIDGQSISIEAKLFRGLNNFTIVGLPDRSVNEAKDRISSAILSSKLPFPYGKLLVNLSPASVEKHGSELDLAMCLAVLQSNNAIRNIKINLSKTIIIGELGLNGDIRHVLRGPALVIAAKKLGYRQIILPVETFTQTYMIPGIKQISVANLLELTDVVMGKQTVQEIPKNQSITTEPTAVLDWSDRPDVQRVLTIAAAGRHNILLDGPPGSGKTTLLNQFGSTLPHLSEEKKLEVLQIHSLNRNIMYSEIYRPMVRSPHHTTSHAALVGGGSGKPSPGEITLAHNGVLFLDEISEFSRRSLESLRQPISEKKINISRAGYKVTFPADFQLIATRNPCPCGWLTDLSDRCRCTAQQVHNYNVKLSGAILDRIDIKYQIGSHIIKKEHNKIDKEANTRNTIETIKRVREMQVERLNTALVLSKDATKLSESIIGENHISLRSMSKIKSLAQTISDIEKNREISESNVLEAFSLNNFSAQ